MNLTYNTIYAHLASMVKDYERLTTEREFLLNGVQARLAEVNADRQDLIAEAQAQLDRLNALRTAAGMNPLTLQEIRDIVNRVDRRGPRSI